MRRALRARRRAVPAGARRRAVRGFARNLPGALGVRRFRHFGVYQAGDGELDPLPALKHSRFGEAALYLPALDAILVPLVGFDDRGHRLGMGGGFYDRALADLARRPRRPRLIGVAFEFQRRPRLREAAWDQPLDQVVTDVRRYLLS